MSDKTNGSTNGTATKVDSAALSKAFGLYDAAEAKVHAAETALEKAKSARSAAVETIVAAAGGQKGPFKHPTSKLVVTAVERTNKETGVKTWFFKGPRDRDVIEV